MTQRRHNGYVITDWGDGTFTVQMGLVGSFKFKSAAEAERAIASRCADVERTLRCEHPEYFLWAHADGRMVVASAQPGNGFVVEAGPFDKPQLPLR